MAKLNLPSTVVTRPSVESVRSRIRTRRLETVHGELDELIDQLKAMPPGPEKDALRERSLVLADEMVGLATKF